MWTETEVKMTKNVTMAVDEELLKKARKVAVEKNTTVTGLFRIFLYDLVEQEEKNKDQIIADLAALFDQSGAVVGEKTWTRDSLHER